MALSDELARMSAQAKQVEDRYHAAQSEQRAKLEEEITNARATAERRNDDLRKHAEEAKAEVSSGWRHIQQQWDGQMREIRTHLDTKRDELDAKRAATHADNAEADAEFAISMAQAAIDEAEYACLQAVLARDKANELAVGH
jgi:hypothetical protein